MLAPKPPVEVLHQIPTEVVNFADFEKYGSFEKAKENGKLKVEGKNYLVKDGDVLFFRVNP